MLKRHSNRLLLIVSVAALILVSALPVLAQKPATPEQAVKTQKAANPKQYTKLEPKFQITAIASENETTAEEEPKAEFHVGSKPAPVESLIHGVEGVFPIRWK